MLHAYFTPIALCFVYTYWYFYAFYGTNLLTRCHSVSSYFLLFFYSSFLPKEIFSELDGTKLEVPILLSCTRSPKKIWRRAPRQPHHVVARTSGRAWPWCGPLGRPPTSLFRLYIASDVKTVNSQASINEKFRSYRRPVLRDRSLCSGILPGWGIAPGAIFIDSTAIFIAVADSPDKEGVVLPRGWWLYR
jgi:hypothetical protein